MKTLGIIRKIDDLGRIVIPKEVRDSQEWKSGQSMEMFMDGDNLVLSEYGKESDKKNALVKLEVLINAEESKVEKKLLQEIHDYVKGE